MLDRSRFAILAAIVAASLYAFIPNLVRLAFESHIPALETVTVRTISASVFLGGWALFLKQSFNLPRHAIGSFIALCVSTLAISTCYLASLQFISVGLAVIIFFTAPVIILMLSPFLEGRNLLWRECVLAFIAFAGLAVAIGPTFKNLSPVGLVLAAIAAVCYAGQFFSGRALGPYVQPQALASMVHSTILFPVLLAAWWFGDGHVALLNDQANGMAWFLVLLVGVIYCAAYVMQMSAVKAAPASVVAPWFNLEPVVTTGLAVILLGESLSQSHIIGGLMVLGALTANAWRGPRIGHGRRHVS